MSVIIKKTIFGILAFGLLTAGFAQTTSEDSQIELPDLTTVVSGSNDQEDFAPAPDFEDVLDMTYTSGELVPVLPSISVGDEADVSAAGAQDSQKDIYAEGKIGGGYPATFTGDFQIARLYGADPFKISFTHESASGFASHNLADDFNTSNTAIGIEKDFIRRDLRWGFAGSYRDVKNGLQRKTEGIAANNQDSVEFSANVLWSLPKDFKFTFDVDSEFYYRFADITKNSAPSFTVPDWIRSTCRVTADPELGIFWSRNGFELGFEAQYNLEVWNKISNRGQFDLDFSWQNDKIKLYTDVGLVVGNLIGDNSVIVPFTVGLDTYLPVYFSDRKLNLSLSGGLASERNTTSKLEGDFKFAGLNEFTSETSDWYGKINLLVPLKSSFTGNVAAGYSRTAFGNGVWTPDYSDENLTCGLYGLSAKSRNELFTDFAFTWKYKLFALTAKYHANWLDIPVLENRHNFSVNFALQSQQGLWGASLDTIYIMDAQDNKPVINLEGYMQVSPAVRICLSVSDILKLLGPEERMYAGQYVANSGNAQLLVKFLF